ncbi:hypothetical protein EDD18DRAFT_1158364 [Armillaria luteobubalina]|uniref:Uncharacterized protein n=1 Tax=Armillaria luteobubalina TaxID=153913 RepID=A0AA39QAK8_9AGAR|nr:hypothetical protein EDD18DRAFT_1158364 [Armillaria luteobubalina]
MSLWPMLNHKLFVPAVGALSIIGFCSGEVWNSVRVQIRFEFLSAQLRTGYLEARREVMEKKLDKLEATLDEVKKIHAKAMADVQTIHRDIRSKN